MSDNARVNTAVLNKRITLLVPEHSQDDLGGRQTVWREWLTVWAAIEERQGREIVKDQQPQSMQSALFTIRFIKNLTCAMRIRAEGALFAIEGIRDRGQQNHTLEVVAYQLNE